MLNGALINVNDINLVVFTNGDLKPYSCTQLQDHLRFIQFTSKRQAYRLQFFLFIISFSESHVRTFKKLL